MPSEVARLDAEELRIVLAAREAAKNNESRLVAALIAELRSAWGSTPWSAAQVMGEEPPPLDAGKNPDAALDLADQARAARAKREEIAAAGWDDSFDVDDDVWGDRPSDAFDDEVDS